MRRVAVKRLRKMNRLGVGVEQHFVRIKRVQLEGPLQRGPSIW